MKGPKWIAVIVLGAGISTNNAIAEDHEVTAVHPPVASEPEKVYVESANGNYRSTKSDEYCFYNEEHDHIHCYDEDPEAASSRVVVVENIIENRTYRSTRRRHDPIATGVGVGLAIGIPLLVHHAIYDRHYYGQSYGNGYRSHYRNKHRNYSRYYSGNYRDSGRHDRRRDKHRNH